MTKILRQRPPKQTHTRVLTAAVACSHSNITYSSIVGIFAVVLGITCKIMLNTWLFSHLCCRPPVLLFPCCVMCRSQETPPDWRAQSASALVEAMKSMATDKVVGMLESLGVEAGKDMRQRFAVMDVEAALATALKGALRNASMINNTNKGSETWQTVLTAAAHDDGDEPSTVTGKRKADYLEVRKASFSAARQRARQLQAELTPDDAIAAGTYWYTPRARRSDAASPELLLLMRQYWHTDEVSRAKGNSAEKDFWKPSKSPNAERHPRRELTEPGGGDEVYTKFLKWVDYKSFKTRHDSDFTDPGRTLFVSTRCKWLTLPVIEQCCCKIHSQQDLYIQALQTVDMDSHGECECRWCRWSGVDGGRKWKEAWRHLSSFSDAVACPKVDLRAGDSEDDVGFWGRKPECSSFDCSECGFGKAGGIPLCKRLEESVKEVE